MDNTRNPSKENSSTYLVQRFIASEFSHEYELKPYDLVILFVIARYLDMPKSACFAKQKQLAKECRMSERFFRDRTIYLQSLGLLHRIIRWKLYSYELGGVITGNPLDLM